MRCPKSLPAFGSVPVLRLAYEVGQWGLSKFEHSSGARFERRGEGTHGWMRSFPEAKDHSLFLLMKRAAAPAATRNAKVQSSHWL